MKKRGPGSGFWNGAGGKVEAGEGIEQAAIREVREEVGISPIALRKVAILDFYFPEVAPEKDWSQRAHVFLAKEWEGTVFESDEMAPKWFPLDAIPYDRMWEDDRDWLPAVLEGNFVTGDFLFGPAERMKDYEVTIHQDAGRLSEKLSS